MPADNMTPISTPNLAQPSEPMHQIGLQSKKQRNKLLPVVIVLAIVAVAGIGFGVFELIMNNQASSRAEALDSELAKKNEALKLTEEKLGAQIKIKEEEEDKEEDEKEEDEEVVKVDVSAARDYIYVGEWGIKIKVPGTLHTVSYVLSNAQYPSTMYISGVICSDGRCQYVPDFLVNSLNSGSGLVAISRYDKTLAKAETIKNGSMAEDTSGNALGEVVYVGDDYYYTLTHGNGLMGTESERQWEAESADAVMEMVRTGISAF